MAGLKAGEVDGRVGRGSHLAAAARPGSDDELLSVAPQLAW